MYRANQRLDYHLNDNFLFLKLLHDLVLSGDSQFIIATYSPILFRLSQCHNL